MVEMLESANILNNVTDRSLVLLDEIGRGTSTYDGISIAWAIVEYLHQHGKMKPKTLFATHYHELTTLENEMKGVINYHIAAKKRGDGITFLRKIVRGAADDSYGIEVAQLAGVPDAVTKRAKEILASLENGKQPEVKSRVKEKPKEAADEGMLSFENFIQNDVCDKLRKTDINTISPLEALNLIFELKKILSQS
jgi:DNA mismatch repair protein MutS